MKNTKIQIKIQIQKYIKESESSNMVNNKLVLGRNICNKSSIAARFKRAQQNLLFQGGLGKPKYFHTSSVNKTY